MPKTRQVATIVRFLALLLLTLSNVAVGQTIVPLNTGYNHAAFGPYPTVTSEPSTTNDHYWINIASYPTTSPSVAPSWVQLKPSSWSTAAPLTNWISARNTVTSPPGTSEANPAYTIFRKCFCLLPNFKNPKLAFTVRADDTIQVWFNRQTNVALQPALGNWGFSDPLPSLPSKPSWFRVGKNCIYVLVEDVGGGMGFDLVGTIEADGLYPLPALGVDQTFQCPCVAANAAARIEDDQRMIREIIKIAEERRLWYFLVRQQKP